MNTKNEYITELRNDTDQFVPFFSFGEPNQSVVIAKDEVLIKDKDENVLVSGNAEVRLDLLPRPRIRIHITNIEELGDYERLKLSLKISTRELSTLELKSYKKHIKGYITAYHLSNSINSSLIFSSSSEPIVGVGNEDTQMQYVVFHLFNFKEICVNNGIYSKHIHLEADNWVVELKSLAESENNFKKLKKEGKISVPISGGCQTKVTYRNIFRLWEVFSIR